MIQLKHVTRSTFGWLNIKLNKPNWVFVVTVKFRNPLTHYICGYQEWLLQKLNNYPENLGANLYHISCHQFCSRLFISFSIRYLLSFCLQHISQSSVWFSHFSRYASMPNLFHSLIDQWAFSSNLLLIWYMISDLFAVNFLSTLYIFHIVSFI